jgi:uncharacterized protein (TIGR00255 family)
MKSMTGYGRGESSLAGLKITVEISSVNRKQAEIALSLPRELEALESRVRDDINQSVSRGRVTCRVGLESGSGGSSSVRLNVELAKSLSSQLASLAQELKLSNGVTLDHLLRVPGVIETSSVVSDAEAAWPELQKALKAALRELVAMREREGAHLEKDLRGRIDALKGAVAKVEKQAPEVLKRYREQLRERVAAAGLPLPPEDDERLLKEIVYYSDRSDISEELARIKSHFAQFDEIAKSSEAVGRTLDFLSQEMNREINTIGSKANDSLISREVVVLKTELEKFREQAMNVE